MKAAFAAGHLLVLVFALVLALSGALSANEPVRDQNPRSDER